MSDLVVRVDTTQVSRFMRELFKDQIPFSTSVALNRTANRAQKVEQRHLAQAFTLRRKQWAERNVKIRPSERATKRRLETAVRIEAPGGGERSDILAKFEEGGTKRPRGRALAIPQQELRRTRTGVIPKNLRPRALNMRPVGPRVFSTKGTGVWKGDKRTFMIRTSGGGGVILQRSGRGKASRLTTLYAFKPSARIDDRLEFAKNIRREALRAFPQEFERAFEQAIRTARR